MIHGTPIVHVLIATALATAASRVITSNNGETLALYRPAQGDATRRRKHGIAPVCGVIGVGEHENSTADSQTDSGEAPDADTSEYGVSQDDSVADDSVSGDSVSGDILPGESGARTARPRLDRSVVLVGLMGAGKSSIGRRLAHKLGVSFVDADTEIEIAAGRTIPEIFEDLGEAAFRDGERRVIRRLLTDDPPHVLATGGGAFMAPDTRALIKGRGHSIWLNADLEVLFERVSRRSNRPLLKTADPKATLAALMETRSPVYAEADLAVRTARAPIEVTVDTVHDALCRYLADHPNEGDARTGT
jgi:shikimate kinase